MTLFFAVNNRAQTHRELYIIDVFRSSLSLFSTDVAAVEFTIFSSRTVNAHYSILIETIIEAVCTHGGCGGGGGGVLHAVMQWVRRADLYREFRPPDETENENNTSTRAANYSYVRRSVSNNGATIRRTDDENTHALLMTNAQIQVFVGQLKRT